MWYNPLMIWLLRSPFHGVIDKGIMLVRVTGRKSGKVFSTPVNYLRDRDILWVISLRDRTWWRNLKGGAPVSVLLAGREYKGRGEAIVDEKTVAESLVAYFRKAPQYAKYFKVSLDPSGRPDPIDCMRAAQERVMIKIELP
jgi:deazaflavin-dependent oxidoreductase (nitroreductase family)